MHPARRLWQTLEPLHAIVYYAPETKDEYAAAGLKGGWMGYFASRSAPLGAVGPGAVIATFHNFAPAIVHRAIPDAWKLSTPQAVLDARLRVATSALRRVLGDTVDTLDFDAAISGLRTAAEAADRGGRALFAGHADLPWPEDPVGALWHGASLLREHRFDGHVAMLVGHGLDPVETLLTAVDAGGTLDEAMQLEAFRGWTTEERMAGHQRLVERGLREPGGGATEAGRSLRAAIEDRTDVLAATYLEPLGEDGVARLEAALAPLVPLAAAAMPFPNPIGLKPADTTS